MKKIKSMIRKASIALVEYFEHLLQAASAALLASAIIVPAYCVSSLLACLVCMFIGATLVVWRKNKEE